MALGLVKQNTDGESYKAILHLPHLTSFIKPIIGSIEPSKVQAKRAVRFHGFY
jgi:hypothetical protein